MDRDDEEQALESEIRLLEARLQDARRQLGTYSRRLPQTDTTDNPIIGPTVRQDASNQRQVKDLHSLLLLSDSALPLGSFAFSSGLESHLAHTRHGILPISPDSSIQPKSSSKPSTSASAHDPLPPFLTDALISLRTTTLPFLRAGYSHPKSLSKIDDTCDASTLCPVARRASIAQGRALLSVWERSFRDHLGCPSDSVPASDDSGAIAALKDFQARLRVTGGGNGARRKEGGVSRISGPLEHQIAAHAHFAPLWGVFTRAIGMDLRTSLYAFVFAAARGIVSAAVRVGLVGPYEAQRVLASRQVADLVATLTEASGDRSRESAIGHEAEESWRNEVAKVVGQNVPMLDLLVGRHELLYTRIFNS